MTKQTKRALFISAGLILLGFIISFTSAAFARFDLNTLSTEHYERKTAYISERFDSLHVSVASHDITLLPSEDGRCRVEYDEGDRSKFNVRVSGGTLTVTDQSVKNWNIHIGFYWNYSEPQVTVYLPESGYRQLKLQSSSGDILCNSGIDFTDAKLSSTSGNISFSGNVLNELVLDTTSGDIRSSGTAAELKMDSTSGDIRLSDFTACRLSAGSTSGSLRFSAVTVTDPSPADGLNLHTTSGNIDLTDVRAENLRVSTTSGDIKLSNLLAAGNAKLGAVSGQIYLTLSDAASLDISTTSGDVVGSLLSPKYFDAKTTSGDIRLPNSYPNGGRCAIHTVSGDVELTVAAH